jgi:hypothetical protein
VSRPCIQSCASTHIDGNKCEQMLLFAASPRFSTHIDGNKCEQMLLFAASPRFSSAI